MAKLLEETSFNVWEECTMAHKRAFEALDETLRQNSQIMGGITLVILDKHYQSLQEELQLMKSMLA